MRTLSTVLREQYGEKIYKLSLSSGCTCPNRDGTVGFGGCAFCSEGGSGEFASTAEEIEVQIEEAKERIRKKVSAERFIAYFQSFTNTYGDVGRLTKLYEKMLQYLNQIKPVWVELGLQTMHDETAARMNRGYPLVVFEEALRKLKCAGIQVIVHVIFGLPGESKDDMLQTIRYLAELDPVPDGVKLQMLNILKGTLLARQYEEKLFPLLSMEEYTDLVAKSIRIFPEDMILHRMTGDGPGNLLIAPDWIRNKKKVLNTIHRKMAMDHR